jgi:ATP-binding cassette subfamily C (CFTR/MRP) protein 1
VSCALNYFLFWGLIFPLIVIVAVAIGFGYQYFAAFYRASAREVKRLGVYFMSIRMTIFLNSYSHFADSMLRSLLYSHLSESLTGQIRFIL